MLSLFVNATFILTLAKKKGKRAKKSDQVPSIRSVTYKPNQFNVLLPAHAQHPNCQPTRKKVKSKPNNQIMVGRVRWREKERKMTEGKWDLGHYFNQNPISVVAFVYQCYC